MTVELATLNDDWKREHFIEDYQSLVWTERFADVGDFELVVLASEDYAEWLVKGVYMTYSKSKRLMVIDTVNSYFDDDGINFIKVSGPSLEHVLDDRIAMPAMAGTKTTPKWTITDKPAAIVRKMFATIVGQGALSAGDMIPGYQAGNLYPVDTIPEPSTKVTLDLDPDTLLNSIKLVCNAYNLGFRLYYERDSGRIYFNVYSGNDRTAAQSRYPAIVFSPEMDSLANMSMLTSDANYKNVAYVFAQNGSAIVYALDVPKSTNGFDRRALLVKADDLDMAAGTALNAAMKNRGILELAKYNKLTAFDGEVSQDDRYQYDVDYFLGDIVEVRDQARISKYVRITEQIFSNDVDGEKAYPTMVDVIVITPGSWYDLKFNIPWTDPTYSWNDAIADPDV